MAAKALFIVSFINVPKLLADFVILQGQGFRSVSYWSGFIGSQLLLSTIWLLPYAALATVTSSLRQFFLAVLFLWVLLILPFFFWARLGLLFFQGYWYGALWIQNFVIIGIALAASLVILRSQYSRRRTARSRLIAICALILILGIPHVTSVHEMLALQMRLSKSGPDVPPIQIGLDSTRKEPKNIETGRRFGYEGTVAIAIPLQITLPAGMSFTSDDVKVEITEPGGKVSEAGGTIQREFDGVWERLFVHPETFKRLKDEQVVTRHLAYLSLLGDRSITQIYTDDRGTLIPDLGICRFVTRGSNYYVTCFRPFRTARVFAEVVASDSDYEFDPEPASYSPFPAEGGINPLVVSAQQTGSSGRPTPAVLTRPLFAHIRNDFEIRGLRLADYALPY